MVLIAPIKNVCILITFTLIPSNNAMPSFVLSTDAPISANGPTTAQNGAVPLPQMYDMIVEVSVVNRFAVTTVSTSIVNYGSVAQESTFAMILPDAAFLSYFLMTVDSKRHVAYIKSKEDALDIYEKAVEKGNMAAHVERNIRDSNVVTVRINMKPNSKASFSLIYEELLNRSNGTYEIVVNIFPGNPLKNLNIRAMIKDQQKISFVKTPVLRTGEQLNQYRNEHDPTLAQITRNPYDAFIQFNPNISTQMKLATDMCTKKDEGIAGQFVIQYDVERDPQGGEILIRDGYFVHFFAPSELTPLPKHVVFILDTSGSMQGNKIEQLKQAMMKILADLKPQDIFHLLDFNFDVGVWDLENTHRETSLLLAKPASGQFLQNAKDIVVSFNPDGGTNIYDSLHTGLKLVQKQIDETNSIHQPMIIFLTDGEPTQGDTDLPTIINSVEHANKNMQTPIYSLSFGDGADRQFLHNISSKNFGFTKHIYEKADASLQLQQFYASISSPALSNVHFSYDSGVEGVTKTQFPLFFDGSELVISGKTGKSDSIDVSEIGAKGANGQMQFLPKISQAAGSLEKLWVYLTIRQKLDEIKTSGSAASEQEVLHLAIEYSLVTPLSSFVVTSSEGASLINIEELLADSDNEDDNSDSDCFVNEFRCVGNGAAIPTFRVCDGKNDCEDGSDESDCNFVTPSYSSCDSSNMFHCQTGDECVLAILQCDGLKDCRDGSDEDVCPFLPSQIIQPCALTEFKCETDGSCINATLRCNGEIDCEDRSDEDKCFSVPSTTTRKPYAKDPDVKAWPIYQKVVENTSAIFYCQDDGPRKLEVNWMDAKLNPVSGKNTDENGRLEIARATMQDSGIYICRTGSNHSFSTESRVYLQVEPAAPSATHSCGPDGFMCDDGTCILLVQQCNKVTDCRDHSDELYCAPPQMQDYPPNTVHLDENENFQISCSAKGVPTPEITWRFNWGQIPYKCTVDQVSTVSTITCPDIKEEDQGNYTCEATNKIGVSQGIPQTNLRITTKRCPSDSYKYNGICKKCPCNDHESSCRLGSNGMECDCLPEFFGEQCEEKYEAPEVRMNYIVYDTVEGLPAKLYCNVTAGNPVPKLRIDRSDGSPINPTHTFDNGHFLIQSTKESDHGTYVCTAVNSVGTSQAEAAIIILQNAYN